MLVGSGTELVKIVMPALSVVVCAYGELENAPGGRRMECQTNILSKSTFMSPMQSIICIHRSSNNAR